MVQWGNPARSLTTYCLVPLPSASTFGERRELLLLFKDTATTESTRRPGQPPSPCSLKHHQRKKKPPHKQDVDGDVGEGQ